jgi:uncharacterized protein
MFNLKRQNHDPRPGQSCVLVTGATGGLGKAFAAECAARGWNLFLTDLNREPLEQLAQGLAGAYGVSVQVYPCDLTEPLSRAGLFEHIAGLRLRFWGLINVAGIDHEGLFLDQSRRQIRTIVRLNIEGTLEMTHAVLASRDPALTFRILNVASLAAFNPMPVKATYAASKRFLLDFSLALREELREQNATVTVLCPAGMPTTPECVEAIAAQGWIGQVTTQNTGSVAYQALNAALAGRAVCIPGALNRLIRFAGALLPAPLVVSLIAARWKSARRRRFAGPPQPAQPAYR